MEREGNRPGLKEIRARIQELRHKIEELRQEDQRQRLSRQSQVSWDSQKAHEARVACMDEIKEELLKLDSAIKYNGGNVVLDNAKFSGKPRLVLNGAAANTVRFLAFWQAFTSGQ